MAWSPCPWKRFPGARQPGHRLPAVSHFGYQVVVVVARATTRVIITPTTARETRLVHRTHHSTLSLLLSLDVIRDISGRISLFLLPALSLSSLLFLAPSTSRVIVCTPYSP